MLHVVLMICLYPVGFVCLLWIDILVLTLACLYPVSLLLPNNNKH